MTRVAAVVLAAGEGSRFGGPKQRLLLPAVLDRLARSPVDEIVVVAGAHRLELPEDLRTPARLVECEDWAVGPGASLRCGLAALADDIDAAVVVLADGPRLSSEAVTRVVEQWRQSGGIVAASYAGERGHPLVVGRDDWADVPDTGLRTRPARLVPCDDLGAPGDVDVPDDVER